jgi:hypothetical protein
MFPTERQESGAKEEYLRLRTMQALSHIGKAPRIKSMSVTGSFWCPSEDLEDQYWETASNHYLASPRISVLANMIPNAVNLQRLRFVLHMPQNFNVCSYK